MVGRRLPSLTALRAFEVVARTLSFTKAARELGVTQAAVSRQIKSLEEGLSVSLIVRGATRNVLTDAGEILFSGSYRAFEEIDRAVGQISGSAGREILNVSVAPFFSARWLTPRLMSFFQRHPTIDVQLHHSYTPADHKREGIDIGINWGSGNWRGVKKEVVLDGSLTPVVSPGFLDRGMPLDGPSQLLDLPLFHEFDIADWALWFAQNGIQMPTQTKGLRLNDSHALRRVALDGHGAALFFRGLVEDDLGCGRLVQPFASSVSTGYDYYLNYPADTELPAKTKAFRRWIFEQVEERPYA